MALYLRPDAEILVNPKYKAYYRPGVHERLKKELFDLFYKFLSFAEGLKYRSEAIKDFSENFYNKIEYIVSKEPDYVKPILEELHKEYSRLAEDLNKFYAEEFPPSPKEIYEIEMITAESAINYDYVYNKIIPKIEKALEIAEKTAPELMKLWEEKGGKIIFWGLRPPNVELNVMGVFETITNTIHIYNVKYRGTEDIFETLMHELKHFEQYIAGKEYEWELPYKERPSEKEAFAFSQEMLEYAKKLGLLIIPIIFAVGFAVVRGRKYRVPSLLRR